MVGAGGIGAPAALALVRGGLERLEIADDDDVELSNLHRQILFTDHDVGRPKLDAFADALRRLAPGLEIVLHRTRVMPDTALALIDDRSIVIDATDNFASRFLLADAAHLARASVVHAAAVRWQATVIAASPGGRPCYRCLFEDLPPGPAPDCATAGVAGPVCGVAGALAADAALRIIAGDAGAFGAITTYDGLRDVLRRVPVSRRPHCELCGDAPRVRALAEERYQSAESCLAT